MIKAERDVIIIGAGPAGTICAGYLAKAGLDVLLLDKEIFPRDKACGEILQEGIVTHVDALGAFSELDRIGACIRKLQIFSDNGVKTIVPFECYCAPRYKFDQLMVKAAVKYGTEFRQGCRVIDVIVERGTVRGVKVKFRGEEAELRSKIVIGADGAYSQIAKILGVMKEKAPAMYIGQRAYFKGVRLDKALSKDQYNTYGVFGFDASVAPEYFWIVPCGEKGVSEGYCNVGAIVKDRNLYKGTGIQERFEKWVENSPEIAAMFEKAVQVSPWAGGKLCDATQEIENVGNGFMLIGDAAAAMMPLYNDGLSAAANSAKAAADAARAAIDCSDVSADFIRPAYNKAMAPYRISADETKIRKLMQESMYDPRTMNHVVEHINRDPSYRERIMRK